MSNQNVVYTLSLKDQLTQGLNNADSAAKRLEGTMGSVQGILGALGVAGGIAGMVSFAKSMINAGTSVENATTGLTTLLKDSASAAQVISNTMEDATKAPFGFESLLMANKALISAGVSANNARGDVLNLANAIAATGGGDDELQRMVVNLQQISNTGTATAQDIKQFAIAGINIYKVLEQAGVQLAEGQQATYAQITMALKKAHDEGGLYFNGLENMAANTSVKMSNLGDAAFQFSVNLFNFLKPAIDGIVTGLGYVVSGLQSVLTWVRQNSEMVKQFAILIGVATGAWGAYLLATNAVRIATQAYTMVQWALNAAMNANPIGLLITGLATLAAGVIYAYNKSETFRAGLWGLWGAIKAVGESISLYFGGLGELLQGVFTLDADKITSGVKNMASAMFEAGGRIAKGAQEGYQAGLADFAKSKQVSGTEPTGVASPTTGLGATAAGAMASATPSKSKSVAQGTKVTTINVSIKDLIGEYNMNVTNVREGSEKIKQMVVDTLMGAVNDFQLIVQ